MRAGAFFPDAFYSCFNSSEVAEAAHWPPFLAAAVSYWKDKYETNPNLDESSMYNRLALKAFLFGAFTHQVADVSWHSLGMQQGLLSMLAANEFDGNVSLAHGY